MHTTSPGAGISRAVALALLSVFLLILPSCGGTAYDGSVQQSEIQIQDDSVTLSDKEVSLEDVGVSLGSRANADGESGASGRMMMLAFFGLTLLLAISVTAMMNKSGRKHNAPGSKRSSRRKTLHIKKVFRIRRGRRRSRVKKQK